MIETQLAQIVADVPVAETGKIPGQPKSPVETANMVSTRWGNLPRQAPHTNYAGRYNPPKNDTWDGLVVAIQEDPGVPMISCSIFDQYYEHALCDLGANVNIMPVVIYEKLLYPALSPTYMCVQLTDSTIRYPKGIAKNVLVHVRDSFVLADFVVMDIEGDLEIELILGRPFLRAVGERIDVGRREIRFRVGQKDIFLQVQTKGGAVHPEPIG